MKIAVIDDYQDAFRKLECYARLKEHEVAVFTDTEKDPVKLAARLMDADIVLLTQQRSRFPRAVLERLPKLKLISQTGRNIAHIDVAACTERGVLVSGAGGGNPNPTAELAWGLILSALRSIPCEVQRLKEGHWQTTVGDGLKAKTHGVYATGQIGTVVAKVGRAFEMRVVCFGREASTTRAREAGFDVAGSRDEFFSSADVLTLHLPLNAETRGIVKRADLVRMKTDALIVNTSRAPLIEEGALVEALKQGRPGRAAVDVYEDEPVLGANHPLIKMPNVVCTPHLGYVEKGTYESYYGTAVDNIVAFIAGKPINAHNPEALKKN
ncbi:MAG: D-2-hydroxyacid dehydrogenase family protein [Betaproteobacteria bacterium]|nr:MAG: D-2-hydroxyacid dehydrogenase family protein [Betaproteobacteria bacterium]